MATLHSQAALGTFTGALLLASLLLGGSSRTDGYPAVWLIGVCAVFVPLVIFASRPSSFLKNSHLKAALVLLVVAGLLPLVQLVSVPSPPFLGSQVSDLADRSLTFAGAISTFRPISVDPSSTFVSMFFVLGPLAIFIGTSASAGPSRRVLGGIIISVGVAAALVGLLQVAQGPASTLQWYGPAGGEATGFFANRNHFAALLYSIAVLTSAGLVYAVGTAISSSRLRIDWRWVVAVAGLFLITLLFLGAVVMSRSRAGLALTIVALIGVFILSLSDRRAVAGANLMAKILAGVVALAVLFSSQFAMFRMLQRFEADPLEDARLSFAATTWDAIVGALPLGSGVGTFVPVFQAFEQPQVTLLGVFANRAHNDFLEFALEGGLIAIALMAAFLIWFFVRAAAVWRKPIGTGSELDALLARSATIVIGLLLAHALVDYALRTPAMMSLFAFCCALLVPAPSQDHPGRPERASNKETTSHPREKPDRPAVAPRIDPSVIRAAVNRPAPSFPDVGGNAMDYPPADDAAPSPSMPTKPTGHPRLWGEDMDWPAEWQKQPETGQQPPRADPPNSNSQVFDWSKLDPKPPAKS